MELMDPIAFFDAPKPDLWQLIEVGAAQSYLQGHLPEARFIPWQVTLHQGGDLPGLPPETARWHSILSQMGYSPGCHYYVYDDEGGGWAGRFLWLLDLMGHRNATYIDGGKLAWQFESLPLTTQSQPFDAIEITTPYHFNPSAWVSLDAIQLDLQQTPPHWAYWDARSAEEFSGVARSARRNGHIPGAFHCEWTDLMDPSSGYRLRQNGALWLEEKGLNTQQPIVTYCQSHHRSALTYLAGRLWGLDIKAYPGAWSEWGNRSDTPIISS